MTVSRNFFITPAHDLAFADEEGQILWTEKPKGAEVEAVMQIPDSDDCVVLLNWRQASGGNLLRISDTGSIQWQANCPQAGALGINRTGDVYVRIHGLHQNAILVNSYAGFLDTVELLTGKVTATEFVK